MWLSLSTIMVLFVLFESVEIKGNHNDDSLDVMFRQRTHADWERVWHHESHSKCREKLIRHLYWACEKDIYRLARRSSFTGDLMTKRGDSFPWIETVEAKTFLRTRRNRRGSSGGSITAECCTRVGCTWEEYAEYCPSNKRRNPYVKKSLSYWMIS